MNVWFVILQARSSAVGRASAGDRGDVVAAHVAARQRRLAQRQLPVRTLLREVFT